MGRVVFETGLRSFLWCHADLELDRFPCGAGRCNGICVLEKTRPAHGRLVVVIRRSGGSWLAILSALLLSIASRHGIDGRPRLRATRPNPLRRMAVAAHPFGSLRLALRHARERSSASPSGRV